MLSNFFIFRAFRKDAAMSLPIRTLLRLHVEAVWGLQLPATLEHDSLLLPESAQPDWRLYVADLLSGERLYIWRSAFDAPLRAALRRRGDEALALPHDVADEPDISREIALRQVAAPVIEPAAAHRVARQLRFTDQELLERFNPGAAAQYADAALRPLIGVVRDGHLLSLAHSSRRTAQACELGIDTLPSARRQGYALAATVVWAELVAQAGLVPIYSAFVTNRASLRLAAAAGYRAFVRGASVQ
jgi:RimJ/RimL family protein N-acetyltransferase